MLSQQDLPTREQMKLIEPSGYESLAEQGLLIVGETLGNRVYVHPHFQAFPGRATISFTGTNNEVYIDQNCPLHGEISFPDSNASAFIFGGMPQLNLTAGIYEGSRFVWGFESVAFGVRAWVHGGKTMQIGGQCLFSEGIELRTSDHHSIIDLETKKQINFPRDVSVGRKVWVGSGAYIGKGATIEDGAIVGARSLVTGEIPTCELWVGVPAQRVRTNVSWVGGHPASETEVAALNFP